MKHTPCGCTARSPRSASLEVEPAAAAYQQAITLAEELGMRPLQAHCHLGLGSLYARTGRPEAGPCRTLSRHYPVPCHGHDVLAAPGRAVLAQVEGVGVSGEYRTDASYSYTGR